MLASLYDHIFGDLFINKSPPPKFFSLPQESGKAA